MTPDVHRAVRNTYLLTEISCARDPVRVGPTKLQNMKIYPYLFESAKNREKK
jgi:hypothetical protein